MSAENLSSTALVLPVSIAGANRGALHHVRALQELAAELPDAALAIRKIDPMPGRVESAARIVEAHGGKAFPVRARLEDMLPVLAESREPLVIATDRPKTGATALTAPETLGRRVFVYEVLRLPAAGQILSLRCAIPPGESLWRERTAEMLRSLDEFTTSRGAEFVIGERARSAHRVAEPRHRFGMAAHLKGCMRKIIAGLEPEVPPVTISEDGISEMPLLIAPPNELFQEPLATAQALIAASPISLTRGSLVALCQSTPEGLRFDVLRLRTNGQLMVRGRHALDTDALHRAAAEVAAEQEAERQRLARRTLSRGNAADVTD